MPGYVKSPDQTYSNIGNALASIPIQIASGRSSEQERQMRTLNRQNQQKKYQAEAKKADAEAFQINQGNEARSNIGKSLDIYNRHLSGQPAFGPAGNLVSPKVSPTQLADAQAGIFLANDDPQKSVGAFRDLRNVGISQDAVNAVNGGQSAIGSMLNAIANQEPLPEQYDVNADGAIIDVFGGGLDANNPLAQSSINLNENRAREAASGADLDRANIEKTHAQTANIGDESLRDMKLKMDINKLINEQEATRQANELKRLELNRGADSVLDEVGMAKQEAGFSSTGIVGALLASIPATEAYNLRQRIGTIQANLGFDKLQSMRDSSPTGGALGQVSERELAFLQATVTSLDPNMGPERMQAALDKIDSHYRNWQMTINGQNPDDMGGSQEPAPNQTQPDQLMQEARDAIGQGADPQAVAERLRTMGIDPGRL